MACKKCGQCCRWSYFQFQEPTEVSDLLKLRGAEQVNSYTIRVPLVCSKLDKETNLCTIHAHRPDQCKLFPGPGTIRPKECRFYVE